MKILCIGITKDNFYHFKNLIDRGVKLDIITNNSTLSVKWWNIYGYDNLKFNMIHEIDVSVIYSDPANSWVDQVNNLISFDYINDLVKTHAYDFIWPSWPDERSHVWAEVLENNNIKGITLKVAEKIKHKNLYLDEMKKIGIATPKIYFLLDPLASFESPTESVKFPCIVKPVAGSGSRGIKIIRNHNELVDFFSDEHRQVSGFQERSEKGFKTIQYCCANEKYIIEEYVKGQVLSVCGHIANKKISFDMFFDIGTSAFPFTAETEKSFPSIVSESIKTKIKKDCEKFLSHIDLNDSPFMFDVIVSGGDYFFIDFGARVSSNALIYHSGETDYAFKLVKSLKENISFQPNYSKASLLKTFDLKKGPIDDIAVSCDESLYEKLFLPIFVKQIFLPRNDVLAQDNGFAITTGDTLEEAYEKFIKIKESIEIKYF
jgi:hypothetical protein